MARKEIGSVFDRNNRNSLNDNFKELYEGIETASSWKEKSDAILDFAKRINRENIDTKEALDKLILDSGTSDAETVLSRGSYDLLYKRLDEELNRMMEIESVSNTRLTATSNIKKPMMTFIDDDGRIEVLEKWEPILQEKRNKLTVALVTSWIENKNPSVMQWKDIHRLKNEYGVEFVNHTHEHKHAFQISEDEIRNEFSEAKRILMREGLTHNVIVQPFGENSDVVRRVSRDYANINISVKEGLNDIPLDTFNVSRITLGENKNNTWEHYKEQLDKAIANNNWIIFKSHSQYTSFDSTQIELIKKIIDYARVNNIAEVTVKEGLSAFGNLIDIGDYTTRHSENADYYVLDRNGVFHSSTPTNFFAYRYFHTKFDTPITEFIGNSTSTSTILTKDATMFPKKSAGTLVTHRSESDKLSFQLYHLMGSSEIYKRNWNDSEVKWTDFKLISSPIKSVKTRQYTPYTVLEGGSTADLKLSNAKLDQLNFKIGDVINATPEKVLPQNVLYNVFISGANEICVRFINTGSSQVTVPSIYFNFVISYASEV